ncbi:MAG: NAD-dependent epimerase/dehydratase family protein [Chitinophagaceae bacterium]
MIIGKGMVAKGFSSYEKNNEVLIFASGVSNSANTDPLEFEKEHSLLLDTILQHTGKKFIYFSTCSVYDISLRNTPYVMHKLRMESLIETQHPDYLIFRVSNIAGKTNNPHTVLNYFYNHITEGSHFDLWENAQRNIISIEDLYIICNRIIEDDVFKNEIINVANPVTYSVQYIVSELERFTGKKANYTKIQKGGGPIINLSKTKSYMAGQDIHFNDAYLQKVLQIYFVKP